MPKDVMRPGVIRLYQAPMKLVTELLQITLVVVIFWILKDWTFTKVYDLSGWDKAKQWASIGFLFWPTVIIAGLAMVNAVLRWQTNYYEIYPEKLLIKTGVLAKYKRSVNMDQFAAVEVMQGIWGRMCGYGDIVFLFEAMTTVITKKGIVLSGVRQPDKLVNEAAKYVEGTALNIKGKDAKDDTEANEIESSQIEVAKTEPVIKEEAQAETTQGTIQGEIDLSGHN